MPSLPDFLNSIQIARTVDADKMRIVIRDERIPGRKELQGVLVSVRAAHSDSRVNYVDPGFLEWLDVSSGKALGVDHPFVLLRKIEGQYAEHVDDR